MEINDAMRAKILTDALPYIQKYYGKTVVVKYGGNAMINPELKYAVMSDIILLSLVGIKVVLDRRCLLQQLLQWGSVLLLSKPLIS